MPPGQTAAGIDAEAREQAVQLRFIVDNVPAMSIAYDEHLICLFANRRFAEFFGLTTQMIVGKHLREIIGEDAYREVKPSFDQVLKGERSTYKRARLLNNGEKRYLEVELIPNVGEEGRIRGLFAVTTDVTERTREEHLRSLGLSVATLIADSETSRTAIRSVIRAICEAEGWDCGRYLQPQPGGAVMSQVDAWGIDDPSVQHFLEHARQIDHRSGVGLTGKVWLTGEPLWVADISTEPLALRRGFISELDLLGALVFPVKAEGVTIGVLAFNSRERRAPDERVLSVILSIGSQIGQFLERKRAEDDLRRFRAAMDVSADLIVLIDPVALRYVDANETACHMLGYSRDELLQIGPQDVLSTTRERLSAEYERLLADPSNTGDLIGTYRRKDGSTFPFEATRKVVRSEDGVLIAAISRDVSARVEAERALRQSEERFRSLCNLSSDVFWEQDSQFRFTSTAGTAPFPPQAMLGKTRWELGYTNLSQEQWAAHRAVLEAHEPFRDFEVGVTDETGRSTWYSISGEPVFDAGAFKGYRGVGRDITGRKLDGQRIERLAHHDALTGLPNRVSFGELANAAMHAAKRRGWSIAILFIDLDGFKLVNDTLGHDAGDEVLREVAVRLRDVLRSSDIAARLGGDEFVALLQEVKKKGDVEIVAEKIIGALYKAINLQGHELNVGASLGISIYPQHGGTLQTLLKNADAAMYRAKNAGKNTYRVYSNASPADKQC